MTAADSKSPAERSPRIAVADDALFLEHRSRGYHPERPERLLAARRGLERSLEGAEVNRLPARDATIEEIARAHTDAYVEELLALEGREGSIDGDTYVAPLSVAAARRAAGAAIALVDRAVDGAERFGVGLLRPPGHHATRDRAMGFCLVNNAAIAARAAIARGLPRVAIVDWDVHHGNGTQDIFYDDPAVLYVSLHQWPLYPGTGAADELGAGEGRGANVNVPLSAKADDAVYASAFERVVVPVLSEFAPSLVIISAGFDAHTRDPLASMDLTEHAYASMARSLANVANEHADGRLVFLLEGGYDLGALEDSVAASVAAIRGTTLRSDPANTASTRRETGPSKTSSRFEDEIERARRAAAEAGALR